ncbi:MULTISPECIES: LLM class flavin-dependent oxidoreductase [Amycolatopsis]|uniref:LLM class flavin-dependent oxidoreductase n=1 Tax=Amycolatopsis TaxID=1813 RepID=UPI001F35B488|nr:MULTISPECIES: LLM class flavin-dependent oxidoreductase [Amycolatopsis]UKD53308.1 LLM class flavin-dependent oxidoreductase [Amycolatopsis sp. FU40]
MVQQRVGEQLRFGVFLVSGRFPGQDDAAVLRRTVRAACAAEAAGFDDVWLAEHHFMPYGVCPSAITLAAHVLGQTSRISVGTAVSVLSTTHPVALAEQWSMLDAVSDGRLRLGVGRGGPWQDLEVFGTGLPRYETGFAESVDLLLTAATGRVSAEGSHFAFREVGLRPVPQRSLNVVVACGGPTSSAVRLAAERKLPLLLGLHADDAEKAATVAAYGAPAAHVSTVLCQVGDDASAVVRRALPGWLSDGLAAHVPVDDRPGPARDPWEYTEKLCAIHPVGPVEQCVETLRTSLRRTGVSHVIMFVEGSGTPEGTLANIARIGAEVLPALRGLAPSSL